MPEDDSEEVTDSPLVYTQFTCVRDGYVYSKTSDYEPYLCYRCMRFLAKRMWIIVHQLQPAVSRPERDEL